MKPGAVIAMSAAFALATFLVVPVEGAVRVAEPLAVSGPAPDYTALPAACEHAARQAWRAEFTPLMGFSIGGKGLRSRLGTLKVQCQGAGQDAKRPVPQQAYALDGYLALQVLFDRDDCAARAVPGLAIWRFHEGQWRISRLLWVD